MKTPFTIKSTAYYDVADFNTIVIKEVEGIHPQQVKWFQNVMKDFIKAQNWAESVIHEHNPSSP